MNRKEFYSQDIPAEPGVYIFRDSFGKIIYVGKAKNLRKRVSQYFQHSKQRLEDPKFRSLVNSIFEYETKVVKNENEALVLESRLIKEYAPYYNIVMRDDKRFLMLKIRPEMPLPRIELVRIRKNDGALYFGPFPKAGALRESVEFLNQFFGLRSCKTEIPDEKDHKHCLRKVIEHCSAPCIGKISFEDYRKRVNELLELLNGKIEPAVCELRKKMEHASKMLNFESAAKYRDIISNLEETFGKGNRNFRFADIKVPSGIESVKALQEALGLAKSPIRIEAFDISNISGVFAVGSMVSFLNGLPDKKNYRRFKIKTVEGLDDFAMINEIVTRRYRRILEEKKDMPDLILIDGGKGQLSSALSALSAIGAPPVSVIGLAKRNEEVFLPATSEPLLIPKESPALRLLQYIRDEAHRFAIAYHRELRDKRIQESILDEIPGIGYERKKQLFAAFGSIAGINKASVEEIAEKVPGIGIRTAEIIKKTLSVSSKY